jgi:hypothetical protein
VDRRRYRERKIATDGGALTLWPGPSHEYHGAEVAYAPELEELFGPAAKIRPNGMYIGLARNKRIAWIATNLDVETVITDDPVIVGLRATYVFERRDDEPGLWMQVQAHVSAPVVKSALSRRVFGLELPDLSDLPMPGSD